MTAARWAYNHVEPAGADTGTLPIIPWYFVPLRIGDKTLGVIGIAKDKDAAPIDSEARGAARHVVGTGPRPRSDRASLAREMVSAKTATETERVRNTLLASISHDFRTPLSSILGSATSLLDYGDKLDSATKKDLLGQIKQETEDLDEMVRNLLRHHAHRCRRIGAARATGSTCARSSTASVGAARRGAARCRRSRSICRPICRSSALTRPWSSRPSATSSPMRSCIRRRRRHIVVDGVVTAADVAMRVTDDGPGIAPDALPHIFDKFARGPEQTLTRADGSQGTGLGLAIAKGIMEAHGGAVRVETPVATGRGARFTMAFPREQATS